MATVDISPVGALSESTVKYRSTLLLIPHAKLKGLKEKYGYELVSNLYGKLKMSQMIVSGDMGPFTEEDATADDIKLIVETLETFHGKHYKKIPNKAFENTMFGYGVTDLAGFKKSEAGKKYLSEKVLANVEAIVDVLWKAVRDENGSTAADLFDGWDTLITKAIASGKLSEEKNNYTELDKAYDENSALDILVASWEGLTEKLRDMKLDLHITWEDYRLYCKAFAAMRGDINNISYDQKYLFGTNENVRFCVQTKRDADAPFVFTKSKNLTIGTGGGGEKERFEVKEDNNVAFFQFDHEMYFGTCITTYNENYIHVVDKVDGGQA